MKSTLVTFLFVVAIHYSVAAQVPQNERIVKHLAFIPGEKDTTFAPNQHGAVINLPFIADGFGLQLRDTSYKILGFLITFDSDCCVYELLSNGERIIPRNDSVVQYKRINETSLLTIEKIRVVKNGVYNYLPSLIYRVQK